MKLNNHPTISVLLCTYNDAPFLAEAIQSILDQSFEDFEFIIINDGSTDETENVIQSFSDTRIVYLDNVENRGLEFSKNRGIEAAKGKYIVYQDGDDLSERKRLQIQFDFMEKHPEVGICSTAMRYFGIRSGSYNPPVKDEDIRIAAFFGMPLPHAVCMIRKSVLEKQQIRYRYDFDAAEDHPFMVDLLTATRAFCIRKPLYRYRIHKESTSLTKRQTQIENSARAGRLAFEKLLNIEVTEVERQAIQKVFGRKPTTQDIQLFEPLLEKVKTKANENDFKQFFIKKGRQKITYHRGNPVSRFLNLFRLN